LSDLKDIILQTIEELDYEEVETTPPTKNESKCNDEFLITLKEKILVLFEGLQSNEIIELDKKVDLIINFLEFILAEIDKRLDARDN